MDSILLEKVSQLLVSARVSIDAVEDLIEFYRTGKLTKTDDIADQRIEFKLDPVEEKPPASHFDLIRDSTDDIGIILDKLINEVSSLYKIQ